MQTSSINCIASAGCLASSAFCVCCITARGYIEPMKHSMQVQVNEHANAHAWCAHRVSCWHHLAQLFACQHMQCQTNEMQYRSAAASLASLRCQPACCVAALLAISSPTVMAADSSRRQPQYLSACQLAGGQTPGCVVQKRIDITSGTACYSLKSSWDLLCSQCLQWACRIP